MKKLLFIILGLLTIGVVAYLLTNTSFLQGKFAVLGGNEAQTYATEAAQYAVTAEDHAANAQYSANAASSYQVTAPECLSLVMLPDDYILDASVATVEDITLELSIVGSIDTWTGTIAMQSTGTGTFSSMSNAAGRSTIVNTTYSGGAAGDRIAALIVEESEACSDTLKITQAAPGDDDGDGVNNLDDKCPNYVPTGADTDGDGCTDDTDGDGVDDDNDLCINKAPKGPDTDGDGCTDPVVITDTDGDGVDDDNDLCPDEDATGQDTDLDGCIDPVVDPVVDPGPVEGDCTHPFGDVAPGYWGEGYICDAYEETIVSGKTSTIFDPDASVTKAEFLKMALRVAGYSSADATGSEEFVDVSSSDWYYPWVRIAEQLDVLKITDSFFNPNIPITRADATVMLVRIAGETLYGWTEDDIPFYDVSSSNDFAYAILIAYADGVIEGYLDGSFGPYNYITRAEAVTIVLRATDAWFQ